MNCKMAHKQHSSHGHHRPTDSSRMSGKAKSALFKAIKADDLQAATQILKDYKQREDYVNAHFTNLYTPLMMAIVHGQNNMAKLLLENCADPSLGCRAQDLNIQRPPRRSIFGSSGSDHKNEIVYPLQVAAEAQNVRMVELLLAHGAKPNREYDGGLNSLIHFAVKMNATTLVDTLAKWAKEDEIYQMSHIDLSHHLMTAVNESNVRVAEILMSHGANPNKVYCGVMPVVMAANKADMPMCMALINGGCILNNISGTIGVAQTPLSMAVSAGMDTAVATLITLGSDVNAKTDWTIGSQRNAHDFYLRPRSPMLHFAVFKRNLVIARQLLEQGADPHGVDSECNTALHLACYDPTGFTHMVKYLLTGAVHSGQCSHHRSQVRGRKVKINVDRRNRFGMTALMIAAKNKNAELVEMLLSQGANPNITGVTKEFDHTALHFAVTANNEASLLALLRGGALVDGDHNKMTPLHFAVRDSNMLFVDILLQFGANPCILTAGRESCYHLAIAAKSLELVELFLQRGLSVNVASSNGETPLMMSARQDCADICKTLIQHGALLNVRDRNKETALLLSVYFGYEDNARILIAEGADMNIGDKKRTTPIYWCIFNSRVSTLQRLLLAGAGLTHQQFLLYPRNLTIMRNQPLIDWVLQSFKEVRSLQALCTLAARAWLVQQARGQGIGQLVERLPVPGRIKAFLMLQTPEFDPVEPVQEEVLEELSLDS